MIESVQMKYIQNFTLRLKLWFIYYDFFVLFETFPYDINLSKYIYAAILKLFLLLQHATIVEIFVL